MIAVVPWLQFAQLMFVQSCHGKEIPAANGCKIPRRRAASTADEAVAARKSGRSGAAKEIAGSPQDESVRLADKKGEEVVIKIQAWTTGRAGLGGSIDIIDPPPPAP